MTKTKVVICPYCGETQSSEDRCKACGGLFEPLSRRATHNAMGPWWIRDPDRPFQPGCSYETLTRLVDRGVATKYTILRGPTTRQFWTVAKHVPGIAHLLGYCHACDSQVDPSDHGCHACGVPFGAYLDRNYLGLPEVHPMPWEDDQAADDVTSTRSWRDAADHGWSAPAVTSGGRISSFARDEELLQRESMSRMMPAPVAPAIGDLGEATTTTLAPVTEGREAVPEVAPQVAESELNSAAAQSMRRRIAQQRRTIRTLWIIAGVCAAIAAIELVVLLVS